VYAIQGGAHHKKCQKQRQTDNHLIWRNGLSAQGLPEKGKHNHNARKSCHHQQQGWQKRQCREK
jgi:hypothetical protein